VYAMYVHCIVCVSILYVHCVCIVCELCMCIVSVLCVSIVCAFMCSLCVQNVLVHSVSSLHAVCV